MARKDSVDKRLSTAGVAADAHLASMGYKAELPRTLSVISVLGMYDFTPDDSDIWAYS